MPASFREGVRLGLPYAAAGFVLSLSFGVLAVQAGFSEIQAIVMSLIVFAGSAQFASLSIMAGGGGVVSAILAASLMNSRFLPMGIALAPSLPGGPLAARGRRGRRSSTSPGRWPAAATAPSTAGSCSAPPRRSTSPGRWEPWSARCSARTSATRIASASTRSSRPSSLALLIAELRAPEARLPAAVGAMIALVLVPFAPAGVPILVASLAALFALRR